MPAWRCFGIFLSGVCLGEKSATYPAQPPFSAALVHVDALLANCRLLTNTGH